MKAFKSPEEAITACNTQLEAAWSVFAASQHIEESMDPAAYSIAKMVFRAGFMNGASYVSGYMVERLKDAKQEIKTEENKGA